MFYAVYRPSVRDLSLQSMLLASLQLGQTAVDSACSLCGGKPIRLTSISQFPTYLNVAISRTFFNEKTHALLKDCSHVYINPVITLQNVDLLAGCDRR